MKWVLFAVAAALVLLGVSVIADPPASLDGRGVLALVLAAVAVLKVRAAEA